MEPTILWAIVGIIAIVIILILGYQAWRRNNSPVSSRRSRRGSFVDERMQYSRSQQENGSSVGESNGSKASPQGYSAHNPIQTGSSHQGNTPDEWSYPPKHPQTENTGDEPTHLGSSQKGNATDEQTRIKPAGKRNIANKQTYIGSSQKGDSADEQTYLGRNRNKNVMPEDDRTVF
jgi:FtsZ-interacting cell division protein ZipA